MREGTMIIVKMPHSLPHFHVLLRIPYAIYVPYKYSFLCYRSLDYTINGFYHNHITVFSEVVPVHLDMSTDNLVLEPQIGLPADAGLCFMTKKRNKDLAV